MALRWYVGPWQWRDAPGPSWNPPVGFSGLDLRSLPDHAPGTSGLAVFFGPGPDPGSDYTIIGSGSWTDLKPTGKVLAALPRRKGFAPTGDTLRDVILSLLSEGADPDGLDAAKPIVPTAARFLELHAANQPPHVEAFRWGDRHTSHIRDMLRKEFAANFAAAKGGRTRDPEIHRRVLDVWCIKYGVSDWREFVPPNLRAEVPGRLPHATSISDSFDTADSSTLGPGLTWTEVSGNWTIKSNAAGKPTDGGVPQLARADTDLSSADHYAQITRRGTDGNSFHGPAIRCPVPSATTCYGMGGFFSAYMYLFKLVAGAQTNLTNVAQAPVSGDTYKLSVNGSTLKEYVNGSQIISHTDTSITGNLRCGMTQYLAAESLFENFAAADLINNYTASLTGAVSLAGAAAKAVGRGPSGAVTMGGAVGRATGKACSGSTGATGAVGRATGKARSGSTGATGSVGRATGKAMTGAASLAGAGAKAVGRGLVGAASLAGAVGRATGKALAGAVSLAGSLLASRLFSLALSGSVAASGAVAKAASRSLAGVVNLAGAAAKAVGRVLSGALSLAGFITTDQPIPAKKGWTAAPSLREWSAVPTDPTWQAVPSGSGWAAGGDEMAGGLVRNVLVRSPADDSPVWMDFGDCPELQDGTVTISSCAVTESGSAALTIGSSGAAAVDNEYRVSIPITGGVDGTTYYVRFYATLSNGKHIERIAPYKVLS